MMKAVLLLVLALLLITCSPGEKDVIFHYSVLKALDNGVIEGNMKAGELKQHGNFGLGTFNTMNGEMIVLDNVVYRVAPEGNIVKADDQMLIPYSIVTFYNQDGTLNFDNDTLNYPALKSYVAKAVPSPNLFYAFRITGEFDYIKCGGSNIQERPYDKSLTQMLETRPVYEGRNIKGTLVGFWCPEFIGDINTSGFHLHFISDDHTFGGHLMEFTSKSLAIGYDLKLEYRILLPDTEIFRKARFRDEEVNY